MIARLLTYSRMRRHARRRRGFLSAHSGRPTVDTFPALTNNKGRRR
jgi:hypothetical protein